MDKIIGIAGSPLRNGNSTTLMRQVLHGAADAASQRPELLEKAKALGRRLVAELKA